MTGARADIDHRLADPDPGASPRVDHPRSPNPMLKPETIDRAFANIEITEDPVASSLKTSAEHAFATGLLRKADLAGIFDLALLRDLLGTDVDDAGLGKG